LLGDDERAKSIASVSSCVADDVGVAEGDSIC
jgi:hypothetical protein